MIFNSIFFFATLSIFLAIYFAMKKKRSIKAKVVTLSYSYFFYGMWNPAYLLLIMTSTIIDYLAAIGIEVYPEKKKLFLIVSLTVNLGLLGFFKYFNFFIDSIAILASLLGFTWEPPLLKIILPIGISFYTFQTLSYTIDVYRGEVPAKRQLLDIALFVAFFPQLVAGPIVRAKNFLPQLSKEPIIRKQDIANGVILILFGLFLKVVIADNVAFRVNTLFSNWQSNGIPENWAAAMLFGVQIYGDFAGYSLIAIGIAKIMGYYIPRNFNAPYTAAGFSDFWRRWHISLSLWLRDYLYISLGGNRKGTRRTYSNIMITMLLGGLWHGASFMFIFWGVLHGMYLCVERLLREYFREISIVNRCMQRLMLGFVIVFTYLMVSITWIPFRAVTVEQGISMMKGLFYGNSHFDKRLIIDFLVIGGLFLSHCVSRKYDFLKCVEQNSTVRFITITFILLSFYYYSGERTDFIYFQF